MKTLSGAFVLVFIAALSAACSGGGSSSPIPTAPTAPTGTPTVETFDGTVDVGGSDVHPFTVALASSQVSVTLNAAAPPPTIYMGVAVGSYSNGTCTPLTGATVLAQAGTVAQLSGTANPGSYCVEVYDAGNQLAQSVTYTVSVSHF